MSALENLGFSRGIADAALKRAIDEIAIRLLTCCSSGRSDFDEGIAQWPIG